MGRKWNNIKEKKAQKDGNTSKIYAKFGREIYVAAKKGEVNPESNMALKVVLDKAKTHSVPKHIIDRALEKARGNDDEVYDELRYEGFGPGGSLLIVEALTNNVNRTASDVRAAFGKNGGNMGNNGSVSYMFDARSVFVFTGYEADDVLMHLVENEVEVLDVEDDGEAVIVYGETSMFNVLKTALEEMGVEDFEVAELTMLPQTEIALTGEDGETFDKLINALDDLEDVSNIYHNVVE